MISTTHLHYVGQTRPVQWRGCAVRWEAASLLVQPQDWASSGGKTHLSGPVSRGLYQTCTP
eukprot:scaffold115_cov304-Prasinococcus_capsulatus_cf.AAC.49